MEALQDRLMSMGWSVASQWFAVGIVCLAMHVVFRRFFPRWWYRSWLTKWFLTPMFHDQHHQLFHCNYGGFTTIWDRVFGTVNPAFEADYERLKAAGDTAK